MGAWCNSLKHVVCWSIVWHQVVSLNLYCTITNMSLSRPVLSLCVTIFKLNSDLVKVGLQQTILRIHDSCAYLWDSDCWQRAVLNEDCEFSVLFLFIFSLSVLLIVNLAVMLLSLLASFSRVSHQMPELLHRPPTLLLLSPFWAFYYFNYNFLKLQLLKIWFVSLLFLSQ